MIMKMKKYLLIILAAVGITTASSEAKAQSPIRYGARAALNLSQYSGDIPGDMKAGAAFGVFGNYALTHELFLQAGLDISLKGTKDKVMGVKTDFNPIYLQLPIHIGYNLPLNHISSLKFSAGPYLAYGLGGKAKVQVGDATEKVSVFGKNKSLHHFDFGFGGKMAYQYDFIEGFIGYDYGITNASKISGVTARNSNLYLGVAYHF